MTKAEALFEFFNTLMTSYPDTSVPIDAEFPYLTYSVAQTRFGNSVNLTVNMWFNTSSEKIPTDYAERLERMIGDGGKQIHYSGGTLWLKMGSPFIQSFNDENQKNIKRRYINIDVENL